MQGALYIIQVCSPLPRWTYLTCPLLLQEWRLALQHASLWEVLDLHNQQDAAHILDVLPFMWRFQHVLKVSSWQQIGHLCSSGMAGLLAKLNAPLAALPLQYTYADVVLPCLQEVNLEFAAGVCDEHLHLLQQYTDSIQSLNLNACQQ